MQGTMEYPVEFHLEIYNLIKKRGKSIKRLTLEYEAKSLGVAVTYSVCESQEILCGRGNILGTRIILMDLKRTLSSPVKNKKFKIKDNA